MGGSGPERKESRSSTTGGSRINRSGWMTGDSGALSGNAGMSCKMAGNWNGDEDSLEGRVGRADSDKGDK